GRPAGPGAGARGGGDRRGHPGDRRHRPGTDIAARPAVVGPPGVGVTVDADPTRVRLDPADPERGLVAFVLTLVELLRQLMERQALRRVDHGDLSDDQVERLGAALMRLEQGMAELRDHFGLTPEDLNL